MAEIIEPIEGYGLSSKHKKRSLFSKIGVVGCGRDGRHIVSLTALSGIEVVFVEVSEERIQLALNEARLLVDHVQGAVNLMQVKIRLLNEPLRQFPAAPL